MSDLNTTIEVYYNKRGKLRMAVTIDGKKNISSVKGWLTVLDIIIRTAKTYEDEPQELDIKDYLMCRSSFGIVR